MSNSKPAAKKISSIKLKTAVDSKGNETQVQIIKIQAYPIEGKLDREDGKPPIPIHVVKVTDVGVMAKFFGYLKVGDNLKIQFELPVVNISVSENVRVIKTYESLDGYKAVPGMKKGVIVELHFRGLSEDAKNGIRDFVKRIGQKG